MEECVKRNCNPTGQVFNGEKEKNRWAALRLLAYPEDVLDACPQESDYWDIIFHAVPEWLDMVKYNFITSIMVHSNDNVNKFVLQSTWELKCM